MTHRLTHQGTASSATPQPSQLSRAALTHACAAAAGLFVALAGAGVAQTASDPSTSDTRMSTLEKRVARLEADNNPEGATFVAPFTVLDKSRRVLLQVTGTNDSADVAVGGSGRAYIRLSATANMSRLTTSDGKSGEANLISSADQTGLTVGSAKTGAFIGRDESGGNVVTLSNSDGEVTVGMISDTDGGRIEVLDKAGVQPGVRIAYRDGGVVQAYDKAGSPVAGLLGTDRGGRLVVNAPKGTNSAVTVGANANGGEINVFAAGGGTALAQLAASAKSGGLTVYAPDGKASGVFMSSASTGAGRMTLSDETGNITVEAGTLPTGAGIVRTGPGGNGPAGIVGGGLKAASSIEGK